MFSDDLWRLWGLSPDISDVFPRPAGLQIRPQGAQASGSCPSHCDAQSCELHFAPGARPGAPKGSGPPKDDIYFEKNVEIFLERFG